MKWKEKETVMVGEEIERALVRMTHEILERNKGVKDLVLIGIRTGGVYLAERIRAKIEAIEKVKVPFGIIDITLYRDDFSMGLPQPLVGKTDIPFPLRDNKVILVDDVLYTGRTVRAAVAALIDFGRPKFVQLVVLIDRGHRELPIQADYVGKKLITAFEDDVRVSFREIGEPDRVVIQEKVA